MKLRLLTLALLACLTASCGDDDAGTTPTPTTPTLTADTYSGTLGVGGSTYHTFAVTQTGTTSVNLGSLTTSPGTTFNAVMALGFGVPTDTDCATTSTVEVSPSLVTQLTASVTPGNYCVSLADIGNLRGQVTFAVRILHP